MRRIRQSFDDIIQELSPIESDWKDSHAEEVIAIWNSLPVKSKYTREDLHELFRRHRFDAVKTAIRIFLELSKDDFERELRSSIGRTGTKAYQTDPERFVSALEQMGLLQAMRSIVDRPVDWRDLLMERLKSGRGSAIKGQKRGRIIEDFVQKIIDEIFGAGNYDVRCRFSGESGISTEKADFAIPSRSDPRILIEVKGYGATGSKLTDILGDMQRIINEKRHDTTLLFVTDGVSWLQRLSDLRKLVHLQNRGRIQRLYTMAMESQFRQDLTQLKREYGLK